MILARGYLASRYIERLREIAGLYKQGNDKKLVLGEPLVGCMVCAGIANVSSRNVLLFDCNNGSVCRVHQDCIDYLLDEAFLQARERAVAKLRKRSFLN